MITKEVLEKLRQKQYKYMKAKYPTGDLSSPMFLNGEFNFNKKYLDKLRKYAIIFIEEVI